MLGHKHRIYNMSLGRKTPQDTQKAQADLIVVTMMGQTTSFQSLQGMVDSGQNMMKAYYIHHSI